MSRLYNAQHVKKVDITYRITTPRRQSISSSAEQLREIMRARVTNLPSANLRKPLQKKKESNGWCLTVSLFIAVILIGFLCFWSMAPSPFNAPKTLSGSWEGTALADGIEEDDRHISIAFNIDSQIRPSIDPIYVVRNVNDDGSLVSVGGRSLSKPLVFTQIQIKGYLWSASAPCGDDGAICAFAVRRGEALLTVLEKDVSTDYALTKVGWNRGVFGDEGGQHKIRYAIVIFVIVVGLKVFVSKFQSPNEKRLKALERRRRNY